MDPSLFGILVQNTRLILSCPYVKTHNEKYRVYAHKFQKIGHSGIISFVYLGKEKMHNYIQYKVSMTVYMGRIANQTRSYRHR